MFWRQPQSLPASTPVVPVGIVLLAQQQFRAAAEVVQRIP
jgi:hypothetical protein